MIYQPSFLKELEKRRVAADGTFDGKKVIPLESVVKPVSREEFMLRVAGGSRSGT